MEVKKCLHCNKNFAREGKVSNTNWNKRKFCSRKCWSLFRGGLIEQKIKCSSCNKDYIYKVKASNTNTKCSSCVVNAKRYEVKLKAVTYKGGKCIKCGYNKCLAALQFHHVNPEEKEFRIGGAHTYSWERIQKELDKCILVCANCHAELHYNETKK